MGDGGGEARDLLHGPRHGQADGTHSGVGRVGGIDGAVGDPIDLCHLCIHVIHGRPCLVDDGQHLVLRSLDERREALKGSAQGSETQAIPSPTRRRKTARAMLTTSPELAASIARS